MSEQIAMPLLQLCDAAFHHPGAPEIISGVSVAINPGDRVAVLGQNGAGKSTLFRLLAGAWEPTAGRLLHSGTQASYSRKGRDELRRLVQLVLQEPDDQIFAMSVAADVSYGPINLGLDEAEVNRRVEAAMAATGISHLADRVPHQLSYGQRKRVSLAGALAMRPRVLLLDEPTAGMDPAGSRLLLRTLAGLGDTAVLLSTHDVNLAYEFADAALVIVDGTVIAGPSEELLADRELLERAHLELPWAPVVAKRWGEKALRPEDLLR